MEKSKNYTVMSNYHLRNKKLSLKAKVLFSCNKETEIDKEMENGTDYIRSLLIMFNNKNTYEIETALLIYEFMDRDMKNVTDNEIIQVYKLAKSQNELFDDYIKEQVRIIEQENVKERTEI